MFGETCGPQSAGSGDPRKAQSLDRLARVENVRHGRLARQRPSGDNRCIPRTARAAVGGYCYHVLNRGNERAQVFHDADDYHGFVRLVRQACSRLPMRVGCYCSAGCSWKKIPECPRFPLRTGLSCESQLEGELLAADSKLTPVINMVSRISKSSLRW